MKLKTKSFLMLSILAIALQFFPQSARSEEIDNQQFINSGEYVECFLINDDKSETQVNCDSFPISE